MLDPDVDDLRRRRVVVRIQEDAVAVDRELVEARPVEVRLVETRVGDVVLEDDLPAVARDVGRGLAGGRLAFQVLGHGGGGHVRRVHEPEATRAGVGILPGGLGQVWCVPEVLDEEPTWKERPIGLR